ncbi:hypothetical protein ACLB2K_037783 [Fragaria x ananassa]
MLRIKNAEMETKNKYIDHHVVQLFPRVDQLWYKYIDMEEMTENGAGAGQIYNRLEESAGNRERIRDVYERAVANVPLANERRKLSVLELFEQFVQCHLAFGAWIQYAKFEVKNGGHVVRAREVYERVTEYLADDEEAEKLFVAFTEFEDQCKDIDRARCVYKFALDCILKVRAKDLYNKFLCFEKQYGDTGGIEDGETRRFYFEDEVRKNPLNYCSWFDCISLE